MTGEALLASGLAALGVSASAAIQRKLCAFVELMAKWNRVYNLTAVREGADMIGLHVLDSLAALPHLAGRTILDVGSGAGLPGIPIAIARPDVDVTLVDSNRKKTSFQIQAAIELELANVHPVNARIEQWEPGRTFEVVISRAYSALDDFVRTAGRLCAPGGVLAAMKGTYPLDELGAMPPSYTVKTVIALNVPGVAAERHLVLIERGS
jgi:16S rRNA (guanine527-N7)-methyltransferase